MFAISYSWNVYFMKISYSNGLLKLINTAKQRDWMWKMIHLKSKLGIILFLSPSPNFLTTLPRSCCTIWEIMSINWHCNKNATLKSSHCNVFKDLEKLVDILLAAFQPALATLNSYSFYPSMNGQPMASLISLIFRVNSGCWLCRLELIGVKNSDVEYYLDVHNYSYLLRGMHLLKSVVVRSFLLWLDVLK